MVVLAMTSTLLLGVVASSLEAPIYLFHNGRASDDFSLTARLGNFLLGATIYLFYNGRVSDDFNLKE
jgi:hypothetical protein